MIAMHSIGALGSQCSPTAAKMRPPIRISCSAMWIFSSILALVPIGVASAQAPRLTSLNPPRGPERSLILVDGEGLDTGLVVWDAGLGSERKLTAAVQGAVMFSVPPGSSAGNHPVVIESPAGRSTPVTFVVGGAKPVATPRLDDVSLADANFDED